MAIQKPSSRNTKAQILKAYDSLFSEFQEIKNSLNDAKRAKTRAEARADNAVETATTIGEEVSISSIVSSLRTLKAGFGGAISGLSSKLTMEANRLASVTSDVEASLSQLRSLHDIEVADDPDETLTDVIDRYQATQEAFNDELDKKRTTSEAAMEAKRKAWRREQEDHARDVKERDTELRKERRREASAYQYDIDQRRKLDDEKHAQETRERRKSLDETIEAREKTWAEREKTLAERETEHNEAAQKAEELPRKLEEAVKKAKDEGAGIARYQAKVKADLLAKEIEGEQRLFELQIQSLEQTITDQNRQIENLSRQLNAALKQAQDLAVKAIEGPSHTASFEALKEIALEQARGNQKGK